MSQTMTIETVTYADDGSIPNNVLPLVVYRGALDTHDAAACRRLFAENDWVGAWVNGVFSYHHYHSTAHEVLGVVSGSAHVQFGGAEGDVLMLNAGDVVVIPAGVGHCNKGASSDFSVVGAYPKNAPDWDIKRGDPDDRPQVLDNIASVPLPASDPVTGESAPLLDRWT